MNNSPASGKYERIKKAADELAAALTAACIEEYVFVDVEKIDVSTIHEIAVRYEVAVMINWERI